VLGLILSPQIERNFIRKRLWFLTQTTVSYPTQNGEPKTV
jgi:hypothetical protein